MVIRKDGKTTAVTKGRRYSEVVIANALGHDHLLGIGRTDLLLKARKRLYLKIIWLFNVLISFFCIRVRGWERHILSAVTEGPRIYHHFTFLHVHSRTSYR